VRPSSKTPSRLDVEVQQPRALLRELVDLRGRRAPQLPAAVTPQLTPPEVVPEEEDDVRLLLAHASPFLRLTISPNEAGLSPSGPAPTPIRADSRMNASSPATKSSRRTDRVPPTSLKQRETPLVPGATGVVAP
jgi:hypothetical protein